MDCMGDTTGQRTGPGKLGRCLPPGSVQPHRRAEADGRVGARPLRDNRQRDQIACVGLLAVKEQ